MLTIVFSGKKGSGKSSAAKFLLAKFVNLQLNKERFIIKEEDKQTFVFDQFNNRYVNLDYPNDDVDYLEKNYSCKLYSFADPIKSFCIDSLNFDIAQCYGADTDKNSQTHIFWEDMPEEVREQYKRPRRGTGGVKPAKGRMTAREFMQVFGTDICRKFDENCWARSLYARIKKDQNKLSIVQDARFSGEITLGTDVDAQVIRLLRNPYNDLHPSETNLDNFPRGEFTHVVDNSDMSMDVCHNKVWSLVESLIKPLA